MLISRLLEGAEEISNHHIRNMMEATGLTEMDLADICDVTFSTFTIYMSENSTPMPKKHMGTIIEYFLDNYGDTRISVKDLSGSNQTKKKENISPPPDHAVKKQQESDETQSPSSDQDVDMEKEDGANAEQSDQDGSDEHIAAAPETNGSDEFEWLEVESIVFRPKSRIPEALMEAAEIAEEQGTDIKIKANGRMYTVGAHRI